ncbi:MAG: hypothetical protein HOQ05_04990 [Corynebacteriales bacterium]|nr:hypothetical protein [Mycobacteriales bacterium]
MTEKKTRRSLRTLVLGLLGKSSVPSADKSLVKTLRQYDHELRLAHEKATRSQNAGMVAAVEALRDGIEQDYEKAYPAAGSAWDEDDVAAQRTVFAEMVNNPSDAPFTDLVDQVTPWITRPEKSFGDVVDKLVEPHEREDSVYGTMIAALKRAAEHGESDVVVRVSAPRDFEPRRLSLSDYVKWSFAQADSALAPQANPTGGTLEGAQRNREEVTPRPLPRARFKALGLKR